MSRERNTRRRMFKAGLAVVVIGALLGITGITAGPAGAAKPLRFKIELCHRTNSVTNPYRVIEVSVDATNGDIVGPDHTGHGGPAFDFTAVDPGTVYPPPHNGDQWGDIIPPYPYNGGQFPGMNWDPSTMDAEFISGGCQGTDEPEDPSCPAGQQWDDANDNLTIDPGECVTTIDCPEGTEWVDANENGFEEEGECVEANVFACPVGTDGADDNENGVVDDGECAAPTTPPAPEEEVLGEVVLPAQLPRTGSSTGPLTAAGLGLILIGAGALLIAQPKKATIGR
jgi:LPXTG-motif cell wall-anchored protein